MSNEDLLEDIKCFEICIETIKKTKIITDREKDEAIKKIKEGINKRKRNLK